MDHNTINSSAGRPVPPRRPGSWLGLTLFGAFLLPILANSLFPPNTSGTAKDLLASTSAQQLFLRISPAQLYQDVVTALMNPQANSILGHGNVGQ